MGEKADIPDKETGKRYNIIIASEGFSLSNVALKRTFGGKDQYPLIDFGDLCVCCGVRAAEYKDVRPEGADFYAIEPLKVPVCPECKDHALFKAGSLSGIAVVSGLAAAALGVFYFPPFSAFQFLFGLCGLAAAGFGVFSLVKAYRIVKENTRSGHVPGLEFLVQPRQLTVSTRNRKLVERIVERNGSHHLKVV